ncbi:MULTISPECIES: helix-turn-helix domain-containing protein [Petrotoga]
MKEIRMLKTYKFHIYPTNKQINKLNESFTVLLFLNP